MQPVFAVITLYQSGRNQLTTPAQSVYACENNGMYALAYHDICRNCEAFRLLE